MSDNAIYPDPSEVVRGAVKQLNENHPEISNDEVWASLMSCEGYQKALKPYLVERIEQLKSMSDVDFNGKETAEEIGIRYLIFSSIGKELQDLLVKIETTIKVIKHQKGENK